MIDCDNKGKHKLIVSSRNKDAREEGGGWSRAQSDGQRKPETDSDKVKVEVQASWTDCWWTIHPLTDVNVTKKRARRATRAKRAACQRLKTAHNT